jgi:C-terminal processing protease CtpA/Prc
VGDEQFYLFGFENDRSQSQQEWTYAYTPGPHMPEAKVYILVNHRTASATEGFAYAMQKLKRATIIGQTTAGAGIAGGFAKLGSGTEQAFIPSKMIVAPHTETGWEGAGVVPEVTTEPGRERDKAVELIAAERARTK